MPPALIVDAGAIAVAAGPVETTVVAGAGSTFTVRNQALSSNVALLDVFYAGAAVGEVRIVSPKLVPVSNGIRIQTPLGTNPGLLPGPPFQALTPQDNLTVSVNGTAADVNMAGIQSYYDDLPGSAMQLKMPGDVLGSTEYVFGWPVAAVAGAIAGNQASTVITTTVDSSDANRWYAVLGYVVDIACGLVGISGVDTSQLFVGGPGTLKSEYTRTYFADLSMRTGKPCVPLFNAANKANTNVVAVDYAASTAPHVTLLLAELNATYQP